MNRDLIIERYKKPKHYGKILNGIPIFVENASCGDEVNMYFEIKDKVVEDAKFEANACSICHASADILIDTLKGMNIGKVNFINEKELISKLGIEDGNPRKKCATLPIEAVKKLIIDVK